MNITKLLWISKEAEEAELTIQSEKNVFLVFAHPCQYKEGDTIKEDLYPFNVRDLMLANFSMEKFEKINEDYFAYRIFAKVRDVKRGLVSVGDVILNFNEPLPSWANVGECIEFVCSRIET